MQTGSLSYRLSVREALFLLFAAVLLVAGSIAARERKGMGSMLGGWDAQFYYAQARSLLFDRNPDLTNEFAALPNKKSFDEDGDGYPEQAPRDRSGKIRNKYPMGLALLEIPWMAAGYVARTVLGATGSYASAELSGYSSLEIAATAVGCVFYGLWGLLILYRLLEGVVGTPWREGIVLAAFAGTSLVYYGAIFPFMSHAAGFWLVMVLLAESIRFLGHGLASRTALWRIGGWGALLFLVRPQQGLLLPVLALWLWPAVRDRRLVRDALSAGAIFALGPFLHVMATHYYFGSWTLNSYGASGEGFSWLNPQFSPVLFWADRGLLWVHPYVVLGMLGLALSFRQWPPVTMPLLAHGLMQIYVIACWSSPEQGDTFGCRMWIECTALPALGVGLLFSRAGEKARYALGAVLCLTVFWNLMMLLRKPYLTKSYGDNLKLLFGIS